MFANLSASVKAFNARQWRLAPAMSFTLLMAILALLFYSLSSLLDIRNSIDSSLLGEKGNLKVSDNFQFRPTSVPLLGEWRFYWQSFEDVNPESVQKNVAHSYVTIPHSWDIPNNEGQRLPVNGFATYQLDVSLDRHYETLAMEVPPIGSAYALYVNDQRLKSAGNVGKSRDLSEPGYNPGVVSFHPPAKNFTISLYVSNHDLYWAGMWYPLKLGTVEVIYNEQLKRMLRSGVIIAILLTIAIFNLIQFSLRTEEPLPFIIALCCLMVAARETETSQILNIAEILNISWSSYVRINFLSFYISAAVFGSFFHLSYPRDFHKSVMTTFYAVSGVFSLIVLVTSPMVFGITMWWYQIMVIAFMAYMMWRLFLIVKRRRYGARLVLLGTFVLFGFVLNDVLANLGVVKSSFMVSFGLVVFVLCQTYLTMLRFIKATEENQQLYNSLADRDKQLKDFSASLESQKNIGQELQQKNKALEELAYLDSLTGLLNRRSIIPHAKQALIHYQEDETPFSLLLVDFDGFKNINDSYGHDVGDTVLKAGAEVMKSALRDHDILARWGGEEFVVLLPSTAIKGAKTLAEKLRKRIESEVSEAVSIGVSATFGVAQYVSGETFEQTFRRADVAMYEGKKAGRNQVVCAEK